MSQQQAQGAASLQPPEDEAEQVLVPLLLKAELKAEGVLFDENMGMFACLICMGPLSVPVVSLPCGHTFCADCTREYAQTNKESNRVNMCPSSGCGAKFQSIASFLRPNKLLALLLPHQVYIRKTHDIRCLGDATRAFRVTPSHLHVARQRLLELERNYNRAADAYALQVRTDSEGVSKLKNDHNNNNNQQQHQRGSFGYLQAVDSSLVQYARGQVFKSLPDKVYKCVIIDRSWLKLAKYPEKLQEQLVQLPLFGIVSADSVLVIPTTGAQMATAIKLMQDMHFTFKNIILQECTIDTKRGPKNPKPKDTSMAIYYLVGVLSTRVFDEANKYNKVITVRTAKLKQESSLATEELLKLLRNFAPRLLLYPPASAAPTPGCDSYVGAEPAHPVGVIPPHPRVGGNPRGAVDDEDEEEESKMVDGVADSLMNGDGEDEDEEMDVDNEDE